MKLRIICEDEKAELLSTAKVLEISAVSAKSEMCLLELDGEDLIVITPSKSRDSFLISADSFQGTDAHNAGLNLHEELRRDASVVPVPWTLEEIATTNFTAGTEPPKHLCVAAGRYDLLPKKKRKALK